MSNKHSLLFPFRAAGLSLAGCALLTSSVSLAAQDAPPPVLVIQREYVKPGKTGAIHEKSEQLFVQAMAAAKSKSYYFGMTSLSGPGRALFFQAYPSLEAWEKDNRETDGNPTLSAALDHATLVDGELLSEYDSAVVALRPDLSVNLPRMAGARYFEITRFEIRPGHEDEFADLTKAYIAAEKKVNPEAGWAVYQMVYGAAPGAVFLSLTTRKTLAEVDRGMMADQKFVSIVGAQENKRLNDLFADCVASVQTNLFQIAPKMSYPMPEMITADPDFWKPKPAVHKPAAPKPATP